MADAFKDELEFTLICRNFRLKKIAGIDSFYPLLQTFLHSELYHNFMHSLLYSLPYFTLNSMKDLTDKIASATVFYFTLIGIALANGIEEIPTGLCTLYTLAYIVSDTAIDNPRLSREERQQFIGYVHERFIGRRSEKSSSLYLIDESDRKKVDFLLALICKMEELRPDLTEKIERVFSCHLVAAINQYSHEDDMEYLKNKTEAKGVETMEIVFAILQIDLTEESRSWCGFIQRLDDLLDFEDDLQEGVYNHAIASYLRDGHLDHEILDCSKRIMRSDGTIPFIFTQILIYIISHTTRLSTSTRSIFQRILGSTDFYQSFTIPSFCEILLEEFQITLSMLEKFLSDISARKI